MEKFKDMILGGFTVSFRPEAGGNMVQLRHNRSQIEILRTPPEDFDYLAKPEIWGMPVLLPPNRIRDGKFSYQNRSYQLPINEPPPRNNCLHGLILHKPWQIRKSADNAVELFIHYPGSAANEGWMHEFEVRLHYTFAEDAVYQEITVRNLSELDMPLMVGFHSAFRMPDGAVFRLDADQESRTLDDLRKIVDGNTELLPPWGNYRAIQPGERILGHCAMLHLQGRDPEFSIRYPDSSWQMRYILPPPWREWVLWNNTGSENFLCAEPQSCRIDAMNLDIPFSESGVIELAPDGAATFRAELRMEQFK
ncbi:MAG: aldose 1-epimerase [Lentisphaerae bacterium]|nr:aldose 1-epimerase [Lentisphaerota bacterium]